VLLQPHTSPAFSDARQISALPHSPRHPASPTRFAATLLAHRGFREKLRGEGATLFFFCLLYLLVRPASELRPIELDTKSRLTSAEGSLDPGAVDESEDGTAAPHALRRDDGAVEKPSWDPCISASMQETLVHMSIPGIVHVGRYAAEWVRAWASLLSSFSRRSPPQRSAAHFPHTLASKLRLSASQYLDSKRQAALWPEAYPCEGTSIRDVVSAVFLLSHFSRLALTSDLAFFLSLHAPSVPSLWPASERPRYLIGEPTRLGAAGPKAAFAHPSPHPARRLHSP
jgi:hypothetical protein